MDAIEIVRAKIPAKRFGRRYARRYSCSVCKPDPSRGYIVIFHDTPDEIATECWCGGKLTHIEEKS